MKLEATDFATPAELLLAEVNSNAHVIGPTSGLS
jgi:hypothetical protein